MKKLILLLLLLLFVTVPITVQAYEVIHDTNYNNLGVVTAVLDYSGQSYIVSTKNSWKSVRVQAKVTGTVTHFLLRICASTTNTLPVGFAVYADTGQGSSHPPGSLLARGYVAAQRFNSIGWWALPFLNNATISVVAGNYYHVTFLLDHNNTDAVDTCRVDMTDPPANYSSNPDKWFPDCRDPNCREQEPPGVGSEPTFASENTYQTSASWQSGLLITEEVANLPPATVTGLTIISID